MQTAFFDRVGKVALGSRLRMLTAKMTEDAAKIYQLYGVNLQPKWFPVFYVLSNSTHKTVTEIATEIGHSQPSVSKIIREMSREGIILEKKDKKDARRNSICLSKAGKEITAKIADQYTDVSSAVDQILAETNNDLWKALGEWESLLEQKPLLQRVKEQQKARESANVRIVDYEPGYKTVFRELNREWISRFFKMEEADYMVLDHPEDYILSKGGCILVALYKEEPVGVCALIRMDDPAYDYELAKMAVSPKAQGKNIGWLLGRAIIEKAKALKASTIYLESNTILKPAISLYKKLGFKRVDGHPSPYERCNIQMKLMV